MSKYSLLFQIIHEPFCETLNDPSARTAYGAVKVMVLIIVVGDLFCVDSCVVDAVCMCNSYMSRHRC